MLLLINEHTGGQLGAPDTAGCAHPGQHTLNDSGCIHEGRSCCSGCTGCCGLAGCALVPAARHITADSCPISERSRRFGPGTVPTHERLQLQLNVLHVAPCPTHRPLHLNLAPSRWGWGHGTASSCASSSSEHLPRIVPPGIHSSPSSQSQRQTQRGFVFCPRAGSAVPSPTAEQESRQC